MAYAEVVFSQQQQLALLGHAITDIKILEAAQGFGVDQRWFTESIIGGRIWKVLVDLVDQLNGRHPTLQELEAAPFFVKEDPRVVTAAKAAVQDALNSRAQIGFDSLVKQIHEWAEAWTMRDSIEKTLRLWNNGDLEQAMDSYKEGVAALETLEFNSLSSRINNAGERAKVERAERIEQSQHILTYGVTYLDDATGGIAPNDLILIGAKTGAGKTQLVTRIAGTNALNKKRVVLFALEAEENEIERRLKYSLMARAYKLKNFGTGARDVDYANWRLGKLEKELGPYEDIANGWMDRYSSLKTVYRKGGEYTIDQLERDIVRLAPETDLIIVDHLHYIDVVDDDEHMGMKKIVKKLRDLALGLGLPIVLVAHMRKTQGGKYAPIIPSIEDFHGSSDIIKIATTAVILSPCYSPGWADARMPDFDGTWATYFRIAKCRLEGSRLRYAAVAFFDPYLGCYRDEYALGHLISNECHWEPAKNPRPAWAQSGVIQLQPTN